MLNLHGNRRHGRGSKITDKETVAESLRRISANLETINQTIKEVCAKSKEVKRNEDREFQLEMLRLQLDSDVFASILTVFMSIMVALITVLITIGVGFDNVALSAVLPCVVGSIIGLTILAAIVIWALFVKRLRDPRIAKLEKRFVEPKAEKSEGH